MNHHRFIHLALAIGLAAATGCDDDPGPTDAGRPDAGRRDAGPRDAGPPDSGPPDSGPPDAGTADAGPPPTVTSVVTFDPTTFQLPEGVVLRDDFALVSIAPTGEIVRVNADGTRSTFGSVPFVPMSSYALGLAVDAIGNVYVAVGEVAAGSVPGVYRLSATGGVGVLFASHAMMRFPNGLDFDADGNLYVADSGGRIFRADSEGTTTIWKEDAMLEGTGEMSPCGPRITPFPIGANGIAVGAGRVVVAVTDTASILSIAINADGTSGAISTVAMDCMNLLGIDGIDAEVDGSWLAVMQGTDGLARVTADGTVTVLSSGDPFDGPASVAVGDFGGARQAVITNSGFVTLEMGGTPAPSVVTFTPVR